MSGIQSDKDLLIWQRGIEIIALVYQLISDFPNMKYMLCLVK